MPEQEKFDEKYREASNDVWISGALRRDQVLVREKLTQNCSQGSILDIGCYDGALFRDLGTDYHKYGIEPSLKAADVARRSGIEIVGDSAGALGSMKHRFDVICAVDVIEHVRSPLDFVRDASSALTSSGVLLISTGNADTSAWRMFGGRYWYCSAPEHISFLSPEWAANAARELDLTLVEVKTFRHGDTSQDAWFRVKHGLRLLLRLGFSLTEAGVIFPLLRNARERGPRFYLGVPGLFEDHMLLVFKRSH